MPAPPLPPKQFLDPELKLFEGGPGAQVNPNGDNISINISISIVSVLVKY